MDWRKLLLMLALTAAAPAHEARLPDGRKLVFYCQGSGSPVVIFEGGYAANAGAWTAVLPGVAARTRACSYDRAGYGASDAGPLPRDADAVVQDLAAGLKDARIDGPYLLVGHSAGGLYVRRFAARYPARVAGLVLIDPSHEDQRERFAAAGFNASTGGTRDRAARCLAAAEAKRLPSVEAALQHCVPAARPGLAALDAPRIADALRADRWRTQVSELDSLWTTTAASVRSSPGIGVPVTVLTAGANYAGSPAASLWAELHAELAAAAPGGRHRVIAGATHMMMQSAPGEVSAAVLDALAAARRR